MWNRLRSFSTVNSSSQCCRCLIEQMLDRWSVGVHNKTLLTLLPCQDSTLLQWALHPHSMMVLGLIGNAGLFGFFFLDLACSPPHPCGFLLALRLPPTNPKPVISFKLSHLVAWKCERFWASSLGGLIFATAKLQIVKVKKERKKTHFEEFFA